MASNQRATQESYTYGYPAEPYYVVLPPAPVDPWKRRRRLLGYGALLFGIALVIVGAVYFLWPSQPDVQVTRQQFNRFNFNIAPPQPGSFIPRLFLNISMFMAVQVENRAYYGVDYDSVNMGIAYRGWSIGSVSSEGGRLSARRTAYVNATLDLDGVEVLHDVVHLLKDLKKGELPLDTGTKFNGRIKVWFVKISLQESAWCQVVVDPSMGTIISQYCGLD